MDENETKVPEGLQTPVDTLNSPAPETTTPAVDPVTPTTPTKEE